MTSRFLNLVFSPSVKAAQQQNGSRDAYAKRDGASEPDRLTENEAHFIQFSFRWMNCFLMREFSRLGLIIRMWVFRDQMTG